MIELHKFVVALDESDALTTMTVWERHESVRVGLTDTVFSERDDAVKRCAALIKQAEDESPFGCKVPCDEHSRCVGFNPQVWEVRLSVAPVGKEGNA